MSASGLVARHLALRFAGHLALIATAATLAAFAVPGDAWSLVPSPWGFGAPLSVLAALWGAVRLRQRGEDVAIAVSGVPRWTVAVPAAAISVVAQLLLAWPGQRDDDPIARQSGYGAVVGIDGSLLVVGDRATYRWAADRARPDVLPAPPTDTVALPPGFVPEPRDRGRLRRQLFVVGTPFAPTGHPLDPTWLRLLWVGGGALGVLLALGAETGKGRSLAFVPLVVVAAWL